MKLQKEAIQHLPGLWTRPFLVSQRISASTSGLSTLVQTMIYRQYGVKTDSGYLLTSDRHTNLETALTLFLHCLGGRILPIPENDEVRNITFVTYRTATVFTQQHHTQHLLAAPFDARTRHVRDHGQGWRPISFDHNRIGNTNNYCSHVGTSGQEQRVVAPAQPFLVPQLLPHCYNYQQPVVSAVTKNHEGLTGSLPLPIALAVFSTPASTLEVLLNSLQPGVWRAHGNPYPSGRNLNLCPYARALACFNDLS